MKFCCKTIPFSFGFQVFFFFHKQLSTSVFPGVAVSRLLAKKETWDGLRKEVP